MTAVTPTDRHKLVCNRCVIQVFGGVFMLSRCFLDFSVGVGTFVIGLSQISSFFSYYRFWRFYLLPGGFHWIFATGAASQQRTLTPLDTWSSLGTYVCSYVETIPSWTCHFYGPFDFRISLGTSILLIYFGTYDKLISCMQVITCNRQLTLYHIMQRLKSSPNKI